MTVYERIKRIENMKISKPRGTFYLFPNIKKTGLSSEKVAEKLLEESEILVLPGNAFAEAGEGYIRFAATVNIDENRLCL